MKRLLNIAGGVLSLLVLAALVAALALTFGGLQKVDEPTSQAFQSPIKTPTPHLPEGTPTPQPYFWAEKIKVAEEIKLVTGEQASFYAWSPASDSILIGIHNGQMIEGSNVTYLLTDLWKISIREGKSQKLATNAHGARWLYDSERIVYLTLTDAEHADVYVIDSDGRNARRIVRGDHAPVFPVESETIMFVKDRSLWLANADTGTVSETSLPVNLTKEAERGSNVYLPSPDGKRVAYIEDRTLFILNTEDSARTQVAKEVWEGAFSQPNLAWSPSGHELAYTNLKRPTCLWVYTLGDSTPQKLVCGDETELFQWPAWFPDGNVLIFSRYPTGTDKYFRVYVINRDGSSLKDLTGNLGPQKFLGLSPDGQKFVFSRDGDIWVALLATE